MMHPPGLEPGSPMTALLALGLGALAIRKAAQLGSEACRLVFAIVAAVFAAVVLFIAINGVPHPR